MFMTASETSLKLFFKKKLFGESSRLALRASDVAR
jgi:hypothetical protein